MCCGRGRLQGRLPRAWMPVITRQTQKCKAFPGPQALTDPITHPCPIHSPPCLCFVGPQVFRYFQSEAKKQSSAGMERPPRSSGTDRAPWLGDSLLACWVVWMPALHSSRYVAARGGGIRSRVYLPASTSWLQSIYSISQSLPTTLSCVQIPGLPVQATCRCPVVSTRELTWPSWWSWRWRSRDRRLPPVWDPGKLSPENMSNDHVSPASTICSHHVPPSGSGQQSPRSSRDSESAWIINELINFPQLLCEFFFHYSLLNSTLLRINISIIGHGARVSSKFIS